MKRTRSPKINGWRERLVKNYLPCTSCSAPRHKGSQSGLCESCWWKMKRAQSPYTGMTTKEYDAQRYCPEAARAAHLLKKYGLTPERYAELLEAQGKRCPICQHTPVSNPRAFTFGNFVVDHNHETGNVRGLLCDKCNKGMGQFGDNAELLVRAAAYLKGELDGRLDNSLAAMDSGVSVH